MKECDNLKAHFERVDKKIRELHEYTRRIVQLLVAWYTFFGTINYASMGWFAKSAPEVGPNVRLIQTIAVVFIVQNLLGIIICFAVRRQMFKNHEQIKIYETFVFEKANYTRVDFPSDTCIPADLISLVTLFMAITGVTLIVAWVNFL